MWGPARRARQTGVTTIDPASELLGRDALTRYHPFTHLNALLGEVPAGQHGLAGVEGPLLLQVGEPKGKPPAFLHEAMTAAAGGWANYPPLRGTPGYLEAVAGWLARRYGLPEGFIEPARHLLPVAGTKEGLFFALLMAVPDAGRSKRKVLIPNPFFHSWMGGTAAANGEAVLLPCDADSGFLPDFAALSPATLDDTCAAILCSPSNPQGAVAGEERIARLIELAQRHDFLAIFDEVYSELWLDEAPLGALEVAARRGLALDNVLICNSLSKRSNASGLRCGFIAGDPAWIDRIDMALRYGGASMASPIAAGGAALWAEESHVEANRALFRENFAVAERLLTGRFGYRRPAGGFFLWLDVGDGEAAALTLWREAGIRVLPGGYMGAGVNGAANPGARYIRVALVYEPALTEAALAKLISVLERG